MLPTAPKFNNLDVISLLIFEACAHLGSVQGLGSALRLSVCVPQTEEEEGGSEGFPVIKGKRDKGRKRIVYSQSIFFCHPPSSLFKASLLTSLFHEHGERNWYTAVRTTSPTHSNDTDNVLCNIFGHHNVVRQSARGSMSC